jgi:hypothetical protein
MKIVRKESIIILAKIQSMFKPFFVIFSFLCCFSVPVFTYAQCKAITEKKDPFTSEITRYAYLSLGPMSWAYGTVLEQKGDKYYFTLKVVANGVIHESFPAGKTAMIKLSNGNVIELKLENDLPPLHNANTSTFGTIWLMKQEMSASEFKKLAGAPITDVKVEVPGRETDLLPKITSKQTNNIMEAVRCFFPDVNFDVPRD